MLMVFIFRTSWPSCRTGKVEGTIGIGAREFAATILDLASVTKWALWHEGGRIRIHTHPRIKAAPYPVVTLHFLSPRFTTCHLICFYPMQAVKGFLGPLGLNTNSIQDTLVCVLSPPAPCSVD
jgi:hypothetical protein